RIDGRPRAEGDVAPGRPCRGTDGPVEKRGAQPMEEAAVETRAMQLAHGAGVAVGQDALRAIGGVGDRRGLGCNSFDRLSPGNAAKLALAFRADANHWILQSLRMIDALEVAGHLLAKVAIRERMVRVAPQLHRPAILDGDQEAARVRAIMRAN